MSTITVKGQTLEVNDDGFLKKPLEWNDDVAAYLAAVEGIEMTDEHWEIVRFLRAYFQEHRMAPLIKVLAKEIGRRFGDQMGSRKHLYELYPCGPAKQACKIAGLPASTGCV